MALRLVMMGTGHFALPTFLGLYETSHEVVGLYTQPDRVGQGHHRHQNPLKKLAIERGTPVFQPEKINQPEPLEQLAELKPDLCVVAAYGQILSQKMLDIPRLGAVNLHASLLPRHRGAAPVQYSIWKGDRETGVTLFQIQPKLDAGPILGMENVEISDEATSGDLELQLAQVSVPLTIRVLDKLEQGLIEPIVQDTSLVTLAPRLEKSQGQIDWRQTPREIDCHIRAMQPWPKPFTFLKQNGKTTRLLILKITAIEEVETDDGQVITSSADRTPGTVAFATKKRIVVQTGDGLVEVLRIQPEAKRVMDTHEFLNGHPVHEGDRFLLPTTRE